MEIHSERAKELDAFISSNPQIKIGEWPLEIDGVVQRHPFYRLPISQLRYNVNNGRLAMEIREWENVHGRSLDANDPDDAKAIRSLLLSLGETDTDLLKEDLRLKGQIEPGVITHDGFVINGNRRMAILELLHEEEPTGKWKTLEAIRLPPSVGDKNLWKIEAGLQLSKDKIAEYHPVNELLKIKQGIDRELEPNEIAAAMYGRTVDEVKLAIERLELIDQFLDFFGQHENYGLIKKFGLHEHFIDIQKAILATAKNKGLSGREIKKRLNGTFALIRADILLRPNQQKGKKKRVTHWDIRELGKVYADGDAEAEFLKILEPAMKEPKKITSIKPEIILESFKSAKEILENKEDRDQPVKLIERAIKALESIDQSNKHLGDERVISALERLYKMVTTLSNKINQNYDKNQPR